MSRSAGNWLVGTLRNRGVRVLVPLAAIGAFFATSASIGFAAGQYTGAGSYGWDQLTCSGPGDCDSLVDNIVGWPPCGSEGIWGEYVSGPIQDGPVWEITIAIYCNYNGNWSGKNFYAQAPLDACSGGEAPPCDGLSLEAPPEGSASCPGNPTNPCNPADGTKSQLEMDYAAPQGVSLRFERYYASNGAYKTGGQMAQGWRHSYSRALDEQPDRELSELTWSSGNQSNRYSTASEACTAGWDDIKDTAWSGDLAAATPTFAGGNQCRLTAGGTTAAYFPVRPSGGWSAWSASSTVKTVTRPNGASHKFELINGSWVNPLNPALNLEPSASDWIFTDANDTEETFDSAGKLTAISYRNGRSETLDYALSVAQGGDGDSSTLDRVTGPFGHTLTFDYDANGRLESVATPDGTIQYGYDANDNLTSVTYPDNSTRQYHYEEHFLPNHLTGITDENGDRFATWDYDSEGRAILSEHAGGQERVELEYNADGTTTLTTANGATLAYTYTTVQGQRRLSSRSGDVCGNCAGDDVKSRTYDGNGFVDEVTDWNDNVTQTVRNSRGLTETLIEAKNTVDERITTTIWHPTYRLPTRVTTPKNVTDYAYDGNGNPTSITISGDGKTRGWTITYNNDSQPLTIDGPRTDVTDLTTFDYYDCTSGSECGQLESITNALNQVTTYDSYDASGRVTQITGPNGLQTSFAYDFRGNILTVTETPTAGSARTTTMSYDALGQLKTLTSPAGTLLTYSYDAAHDLAAVTDNLGNKVEYTYDLMGNLTDEDTYDPAGTLSRSLDYAYDLNSRLDSVTSGTTTTDLNFDTAGNLTGQIDGNQGTTQHVYDPLNRLDQTIDALNGVAEHAFDAHDNVTSVTAPNGAVTTYEYDALDNLEKEISADRGTTTYTYDDAGNVLTKTDARGVTATYTYDALDRLTGTTYPNAAEDVTYTYDHAASEGVGRLRSISDASGTTTYAYDEFGNVLSDVREIGGITYTTSYAYDADGNVASMTYPSGRVVDFTRDALGRVAQVRSTKDMIAKDIVASVAYEPFGPVSDVTYGNGAAFDYDRDVGALTEAITSTGIYEKSYSHDPVGNIIAIIDSIDNARSRTQGYDALNRLDGEWVFGASPSYEQTVLMEFPLMYWRLGETMGTTAGDSSGNGNIGVYSGTISQGQPSLIGDTDTSVGFTRNAGHIAGPIMTGESMTGVEAWIKSDAVYAHRFFLGIHDGGGTVRTHIYHRNSGYIVVWRDAVSVIYSDSVVSSAEPHHIALWYEPGSNTSYLMIDGVVQAGTYSGNLLAVTDPEIWLGGHRYGSVDYSLNEGDVDELVVYDQAVTASTFSSHYDWQAGGQVSVQYTYDANGNRLSVEDGTTTAYTYPADSNQVSAIGGSALQHDLAGNRIGEPGGTRTYAYSDTNRLSTVLDNAVVTASYVHNALGQRVKKSVGGVEVVYLYDLFGKLIAEHDGTGTFIRDYVWLNDAPVAQIDAGEVFSYLHVDHLGTPRVATDDGGTVVWRWESDAFGTILPEEDPDGDGNYTTINLRLPGQYYDGETGFHYNYFRTYNPSTGRYLESDPIGLSGGLNTYGYVGGDPLSYSDRYGLCSEQFSGSSILCSIEDWMTNLLTDVIADQMAKDGVLLPEDQWDPDGVYDYCPTDDSAAAEFGALATVFGGAIVDRANPLGGKRKRAKTSDNASDQFESIERAQRNARQQGKGERIQSIEKSRQREKYQLDRIDLDDLDDPDAF